MPLRDALRGVATLADATEDMLEPAAQLLPEPLRSRFRHALASLERAGKRLTHAPIEIDQIDTAAGFLQSDTTGAPGAGTCASVLAYAWKHLHEAGSGHRHMISETILAERLHRARQKSGAEGVEFAAAALAGVRGSSAIGLMPGLARSTSREERAEIDLDLLTIGVWLLAARAETKAHEEKLLDLSKALVRALHQDAQVAFQDAPSLVRFLVDTSAHL